MIRRWRLRRWAKSSPAVEWEVRKSVAGVRREMDRMIFGTGPVKEFTGLSTIIRESGC